MRKSETLLLKMLQEPGALSFFPSSYFWDKQQVLGIDISGVYNDFFHSISDDHRINLYIHIPFCTRICSYCNCFKNLLTSSEQISEYIDTLIQEMREITSTYQGHKIAIKSIFIGGGTPNVLESIDFQKLFEAIYEYFDASGLEEFLIDGHPNYYTPEKINIFQQYKVTRVTLAIQSFDTKVLEVNNRDTYDIDHIHEVLGLLKTSGIDSNIDLLIGLTGQDFNSVKRDIETVRELNPSHVSLHYFMQSNNIIFQIPDNYHALVGRVKKYVGENPLPVGSPNIQESDYASQKSSILGIGAHSVTHLYGEVIFKREGIGEYVRSVKMGNISLLKGKKLTLRDEMVKYIYLNMLQGIHTDQFFHTFGKNIFHEFPSEMKFLHEEKVVSKRDNIIFSCRNDKDTLLYCNIFFLQSLRDTEACTTEELSLFFDSEGMMIDK